jgi:hypothetical protein
MVVFFLCIYSWWHHITYRKKIKLMQQAVVDTENALVLGLNESVCVIHRLGSTDPGRKYTVAGSGGGGGGVLGGLAAGGDGAASSGGGDGACQPPPRRLRGDEGAGKVVAE